MLAGFGIIMTTGAIAGFLGEVDRSEGLDFVALAVLGSFVAIIAALTYIVWRNVKSMRAEGEPMSRREKLNRNIMVACGLIGGVIGIVLAVTGTLAVPDDSMADPFSLFASGPLPLTVTLSLVFAWAVIMPVLAWLWHTRAIDEQEANAYRDGGYYAAYAYLILAPVWWILWRGGLLPEPDGVAIYATFAVIWTAVWFWKKYR